MFGIIKANQNIMLVVQHVYLKWTQGSKRLKMKINQIKQKIKELDQSIKFQNLFQNYKINKKIFQFAFVVLAVFFLLCLFIDNPQARYINIECNSELPCLNNFYTCNPSIHYSKYNAFPICKELKPEMYQNEFLQPHEKMGDYPPFYLKYSLWIFEFVLLSAFIINHILNNKKRGKIRW